VTRFDLDEDAKPLSEYEGLMSKMAMVEDIRIAEDQLAQCRGVSHKAALKAVMAKVKR
jgi:hypothetical protein